MELEKIREQINEIDDQLIELFARRMRAVRDVAAFKRAQEFADSRLRPRARDHQPRLKNGGRRSRARRQDALSDAL